MHIHFYPQIMT